MLDDNQFEQAVRDLLIDICEVMSRHGYKMVSVGSMMRLVGVCEKRAAMHDQEFFALDGEFQIMLNKREQSKKPQNNDKKVSRQKPNGATLH
jgi:hypothetical protein